MFPENTCRSTLEAKFLLFKYQTANNPNHSHHILGPITILCLSTAGTCADIKVRTRITMSPLMHKHSVHISVHYGAVGLYTTLLFLAFFFTVTTQYWQQTLSTTSFQHQSCSWCRSSHSCVYHIDGINKMTLKVIRSSTSPSGRSSTWTCQM